MRVNLLLYILCIQHVKILQKPKSFDYSSFIDEAKEASKHDEISQESQKWQEVCSNMP